MAAIREEKSEVPSMAYLEKEQHEILKALVKKGAMTPLEISVETLILPEEVEKHCKSLEQEGYLIVKEVTKGLEKHAVILSTKGRETLKAL